MTIFALNLKISCRWILILSLQKNMRRRMDLQNARFGIIVPKGKYWVHG